MHVRSDILLPHRDKPIRLVWSVEMFDKFLTKIAWVLLMSCTPQAFMMPMNSALQETSRKTACSRGTHEHKAIFHSGRQEETGRKKFDLSKGKLEVEKRTCQAITTSQEQMCRTNFLQGIPCWYAKQLQGDDSNVYGNIISGYTIVLKEEVTCMSGARPPPKGTKRGSTEAASCINGFLQENRSKGRAFNMANTTNQVQPTHKSAYHLIYIDIWCVKRLDVLLVCQSACGNVTSDEGRVPERKI